MSSNEQIYAVTVIHVQVCGHVYGILYLLQGKLRQCLFGTLPVPSCRSNESHSLEEWFPTWRSGPPLWPQHKSERPHDNKQKESCCSCHTIYVYLFTFSSILFLCGLFASLRLIIQIVRGCRMTLL